MKNHKSLILAFCFLLSAFAVSANSGEKLTKENINSKTAGEIQARMEVLEKRVEEINGMDFSSMEKSEKKALKEEIKEIKKEMGLDSKFSISIGAAIIIVLLLILIL